MFVTPIPAVRLIPKFEHMEYRRSLMSKFRYLPACMQNFTNPVNPTKLTDFPMS